VKYWEAPYVVMQRQTTFCGGGTAILSSEEDGGRKGVVREHQRHARSTAVVTVESNAAQAGMATCTRAVRRRSEAARSRQLVAGDNSGQTETSNDTRESRLVY
jgi:hypothetical protein